MEHERPSARPARDAGASERRPSPERSTPVERVLRRTTDELDSGRPLSDRARQAQRSVESYLLGSGRPRWMERVMEIDAGVKAELRRLGDLHRRLAEQAGGDEDGFAREWESRARAYDPRRLNELIDEHNDWYPVERDLPMDPRTGDYVRIHGRSYRRPRLDPDWLLERFPASLGAVRRDAGSAG